MTGGNVSFYNQTGAGAHPPHAGGRRAGHPPRRAAAAVARVPPRRAPGLVLLGRTGADFGGSAWAWAVHGHLGGRPPAVDLAAERALAAVLAAAAEDGLLAAAHDLSDGGLAVALAECCLRGQAGAG